MKAIIPLFVLSLVAGCSSSRRADGLDPSSLPEEVRSDYQTFAQRCSKCHALARPLNAGITDDGFWRIYVARMQRMQGSGISEEDATRILRFLHYYSVEQLKAKKEGT